MHIPNNQRKKLDVKSKKLIFMGYPEGVKGYKLYDPISHKFTCSHDVIFLEKNFHDSSNFDDHVDEDIPVMIQEIPVDQNQNHDGVADNAEENQADDQQVGRTFEETFMNEVRNIGERRMLHSK